MKLPNINYLLPAMLPLMGTMGMCAEHMQNTMLGAHGDCTGAALPASTPSHQGQASRCKGGAVADDCINGCC